MQPEPALSPAARDVRDRLEELARAHPGASKPVLAWMLAVQYCPVRLKRRWRR